MAGLDRARGIAAVAFFGAALLIGTAAARAAGPPPTPLKVTKQGYYTSNINGALPPVLVKEVPPAPVCLVAGIAGAPQLCGQEVGALKTALSLNDGLPLPKIPDYLVPQPVPPGELPVGMIGGGTRYTSAMQFDLPNLAPHSVVNRFDLVIKDGSLAFSIESPAFRQAILAALSQYPVQQPDIVSKFIADVTSQNTALADFQPTGIELCMITSAWDKGDSQDPVARPKTDCIVGATGKHDAAAKTWTFDISGVVQAWLDGTPNQGISLSPQGAQNVAYGDPDPSTNFILTLAGSAPSATIDVGPPEVNSSLDVTPTEAPPALDAGGTSLPDLSGSSSVLGNLSTAAPGASSLGTTAKARLAAASASTPWWVWLVVPFVLAGCFALSQALDAAPDLATRRPGALSRLTAEVEHRRQG